MYACRDKKGMFWFGTGYVGMLYISARLNVSLIFNCFYIHFNCNLYEPVCWMLLTNFTFISMNPVRNELSNDKIEYCSLVMNH